MPHLSLKKKILVIGIVLIVAIVTFELLRRRNKPKEISKPSPQQVEPVPPVEPEENPERQAQGFSGRRTFQAKIRPLVTALESQPECDRPLLEQHRILETTSPYVSYKAEWGFVSPEFPTNGPCWTDLYINATCVEGIEPFGPGHRCVNNNIRYNTSTRLIASTDSNTVITRFYWQPPVPSPTPPTRFLLNGRVVLANDQPITGAVVKLLSDPDRQLLSVTTTGADGLYALYGTANTSVILAPQLQGYTFTPEEIPLPDLVSAHYLIFTGSAIPTPTPTPTATPTSTPTPIPSPTSTPSPTPLPTATPSPTLPVCYWNQIIGNPPICQCAHPVYIGNRWRCR